MKKIITAAAGAIITGVILFMSVTAPDPIEQTISIGNTASSSQQGTIEPTDSIAPSDSTTPSNPAVQSESPRQSDPAVQPESPRQSDPAVQLELPQQSDPALQTDSECPIKASDTEGIVPGGYINAKVVRIVDGDTLRMEYKGKEYKVRLLCIDTPETVKSGVDEQPYGKLAAEKLKLLALDREVTMVFEKDTDDNYDRLLAYILLEDGTCVNTVLVEQGFARVDIVTPNTVNKDYFNELQEKAIRDEKGLWSLPAEERPFIINDKGYYVPRYINNEAA